MKKHTHNLKEDNMGGRDGVVLMVMLVGMWRDRMVFFFFCFFFCCRKKLSIIPKKIFIVSENHALREMGQNLPGKKKDNAISYTIYSTE